jgi:5-methylcytosine-specific restriction endonuclease McrBC regulatory subunit McrC
VDAVGVVSVGDLQIVAHPKIPVDHLLYLFCKTDGWPRFDEHIAALAKDQNLLEIVAHWFLNSLESVLRRDLIKDYREMSDELDAVRGQIQALPTASLYYAGKLSAVCDFEEFDADTPLNRILKAAALSIVRNPQVASARRRRAVRMVGQMDDVGDLLPSDLSVKIDMRTRYYRDALSLAHHLLRGLGRTIEAGGEQAWGFLLRTPRVVENGLRQVLREGLKHRCEVAAGHRRLEGSWMTLNPDLTFNPYPAVGDVKYRTTSAWGRSDIYQATTFATGFRVPNAAVISFRTTDIQRLPDVMVGDVRLVDLPWILTEGLTPPISEALLLMSANAWLQQMSPLAEMAS